MVGLAGASQRPTNPAPPLVTARNANANVIWQVQTTGSKHKAAALPTWDINSCSHEYLMIHTTA
jgi:Tol biopolymer transport system component